MEASKALITSPKQTKDYREDKAFRPQIKTDFYRLNCDKAATMLAMGMSVLGTAKQLGTSHSTIQYWLETLHFSALIAEKKNQWELEKLAKIAVAGDKPHLWQANAWLLERVCKDKYAQPKATGAGAASINIQVNVGGHPAGQDGVRVQIGQEPDDD